MVVSDVIKIGFESWMRTLGYASSTIYNSVNYLSEFSGWFKDQGGCDIHQINTTIINNYHHHLQVRKNKRKSGGLVTSYINGHIVVLKRFCKYLQETGKAGIEIKTEVKSEKEIPKTILSKEEIKAMYQACGGDALGIRDKAMLGIYYGCGLRRSEGLSLNTTDILLKENLVHVRKGKGYKERFVPMTETIKEDLESYLYHGRQQILNLKNVAEEAFFLSLKVRRISANAVMLRLGKLLETARIEKPCGLHTLRHSVATHLLQSGLSLEEVMQFLGHGSLESTQIYTRVANEQ